MENQNIANNIKIRAEDVKPFTMGVTTLCGSLWKLCGSLCKFLIICTQRATDLPTGRHRVTQRDAFFDFGGGSQQADIWHHWWVCL